MNVPPVDQKLSDRTVDESHVMAYLQRELGPLARLIRKTLNQVTVNSTQEMTSSGQITAGMDLILVNASAGSVTVTPPPAALWERRILVVKTDSSSNTVTVTGVISVTLRARYDAAELASDGTLYYPFAAGIGAGLEGQVYLTRDSIPQWGYAPWQLVNATGSVTAAYNSVVRMASLSAVATVSLPPSPRNGEWVRVIATNAADYNITVAGNGANIFNGFNAAAASTTLKNSGESVTYVYNATSGQWHVQEKYVPRLLPVLATHAADANTVALWQGDPPGNGGSGLVDSSGNGFTLAMGGGNERYGEIGYGQEGFLLDGANHWVRAGLVNDALLNLTGEMTIEVVVRSLFKPVAPASVTAVSYGFPADTGGNDNVLWGLSTTDSTTGGPSVAGMTGMAMFWETGPGTNSFLQDTATWALNQPQHLAMVRSAAGATVAFYLNGFRQSITGGQPVGVIGGAPVQTVRIGADHNSAGLFIGLISSVKISNVARTDAYIFSDACRCLGIGERNLV